MSPTDDRVRMSALLCSCMLCVCVVQTLCTHILYIVYTMYNVNDFHIIQSSFIVCFLSTKKVP